MPAESRREKLLREVPWLLLYVPLAVAFTWPLAAKFSTELAGERDSWQNLWNIVWIRRSLFAGHNPFFTHALWHPDGATLVFQTFDLPDSVWAAAIVNWFGMWRTYNLVVLWTFVASGASMYALGRGTGCSRPASFFAGCAYTFSTYHFAHALAHLHLIAMQWAPLFVLALFHVLEDRGGLRESWRWAVAGGVLLALASLASWYYLVDLFIVSLALTFAWLLRNHGRGLLAFAARGVILCVVFLALIGPLGIAMLKERKADHYEGAHPATVYSADAESFFFANDAQWLGDVHWPEFKDWPKLSHALSAYSSHRHKWTGNAGENGAYLGAFLILIVLAGWLLRGPRVAGFLLAAAVGIALSLGPELHVNGDIKGSYILPYARMLRAFPLLDFMGMPIRFGWVATFGLSAALAPALDAIRRKASWWFLAPVAMLAVLEHAPHAFVTTEMATPLPMPEWAHDPIPFAVLDGCSDDEHKEWHQTLHGHPMFGTNLSRTPDRLRTKLAGDPVAGPLTAMDGIQKHDKMHADVIDFSFDDRVVSGADRNHFSMDLTGTLHVAKAGSATFRTLSDDGSSISIDGKKIVDLPGTHAATEKKGEVALAAGDHVIALHYDQDEGDAVFRAWWTPTGEKERLLGKSDVPGGFSGKVDFRRRETSLSRDLALAHLRQLSVRYIVQCRDDPSYIPETQLGLKVMYEGADVRIYRVP